MLTARPSSETIKRGVLGEFLLEVKSVNGFAGDVSISCTGGPPKSVCRDFPADGACEGQSSGAGAIKDPVAAATSAASSAVGTSSIGAYLATIYACSPRSPCNKWRATHVRVDSIEDLEAIEIRYRTNGDGIAEIQNLAVRVRERGPQGKTPGVRITRAHEVGPVTGYLLGDFSV